MRKASRQQPSSILEPPLLHDSLSEATYDYRASTRATANPPRLSSITEPDYYLQNSLSDSTYGIPRSLQRIPVRSQVCLADCLPGTAIIYMVVVGGGQLGPAVSSLPYC